MSPLPTFLLPILLLVLPESSPAGAPSPPGPPPGDPSPAAPQRGRPDHERPRAGRVEPVEGLRIAWFATLEDGRREAERTGRPILLVSAAPHCSRVPGVW